jgi:hypothetical protein
MVEWSGTASLKLKSMKRLNIKSLAICFSKASSLAHTKPEELGF